MVDPPINNGHENNHEEEIVKINMRAAMAAKRKSRNSIYMPPAKRKSTHSATSTPTISKTPVLETLSCDVCHAIGTTLNLVK